MFTGYRFLARLRQFALRIILAAKLKISNENSLLKMGLQKRTLQYHSESFPHYYLCNYRPVSSGLDQLSKSLLNFKRGYPIDTQAWIECASAEVVKIPLASNSITLRASTSQEPPTTQTQLDRLGKSIAAAKQCSYEPNALTKRRTTKELKFLSHTDREKELDQAYIFELDQASPATILIIDDILTTGTTMRSMIHAIRQVSMASITIFTLASTDRDALLNSSVQLTGYTYDWEHSRGWIAAEDAEQYQIDLPTLKLKILTDAFL